MKVMDRIYSEKRYEYYKFFGDQIVRAEFFWSVKKREGLVIIKIEKTMYDVRYTYDPCNYISCAKAYLNIVKDIEKSRSIEDVIKLTYPFFLRFHIS